MYTSVYDYTALVQFVGAFNFAFVYTKFDEYLHRHYINSDSRLEQQFADIKADIDADLESVEKKTAMSDMQKSSKM